MLVANRYEVSPSSAAGGMGEVFTCLDTHLQRLVVIKRLQAGVESRRILDEQRALVGLRSKNVVQLYDVVNLTDRGMSETGIVLEYISGEDLCAGEFAIGREYIYALWQIASGLSDIHEAGIIHRDIKPENVRLDSEGVFKIFDFGLSRFNDDAKTNSIVGTLAYMAPELWGSKPISFSSAVDVYAFGIMCVSLIHKDYVSFSKIRGRKTDRATVEGLLVGLHAEIVEVFVRCLKDKPEDRPSMREVVNVLSRHLLKDRHKALVVMGREVHHLDSNNSKIELTAKDIGGIAIAYDGFEFKVLSCSGAVYLNNTPVKEGSLVPGCCVITFGVPGNRRFVTFDVSNPEVSV
ncbi:serine/threonine protein kinase [Pseudomonas sp. s4]|uniref:serine/threonine protein kinase n=1 Tax=Pseudomonas sp. s4 TaxID=353218 RepID=UPI00398CA10F